MSDEPKRDWEKTWIHGVCGLFLGAALGFSWSSEVWGAVIGAVLIGLIAAIYLDDFWEDFLSWWGGRW